MNNMTTKSLQCIAHRGGRKLGTENTLATIQKALDLGVDAIEIDVWQIAGRLPITHDRELGRVIKGEGRLLDIDSNEISRLRHYDGSSIALLEEVVDLVADKARLNIELKGPECAEAVADLVLRKTKSLALDLEQFIVSSFDHQQLQQLQKIAPKIQRGCLIYGHLHDGIACCEVLKAYSYHPSIDFIDPELVAQARDKGMEVWAYTVNRVDDFQELLEMGVTGVFTDDPELLLAFNQRT